MRPLIHLTAPSGWINDPHAITVRDGVHHLFHQYVPDSLVHDPACRWGHAVSPDLVHWEHRPVAIEPGDGDDGIWTGSLAQADDGPVILYTSVRSADYGMGRVRRAVPVDDRWDQWVKEEIVAQAPEDLDLIAYRDPFVMREKDGWRFFIGAGSRDGHAMALTYTSRNLHEWTYDGVAAERATTQTEPVWTGRLWECPQFVDVDGIWAMISSVWDDDVLHYAAYGLGRYDGGEVLGNVLGPIKPRQLVLRPFRLPRRRGQALPHVLDAGGHGRRAGVGRLPQRAAQARRDRRRPSRHHPPPADSKAIRPRRPLGRRQTTGAAVMAPLERQRPAPGRGGPPQPPWESSDAEARQRRAPLDALSGRGGRGPSRRSCAGGVQRGGRPRVADPSSRRRRSRGRAPHRFGL